MYYHNNISNIIIIIIIIIIIPILAMHTILHYVHTFRTL